MGDPTSFYWNHKLKASAVSLWCIWYYWIFLPRNEFMSIYQATCRVLVLSLRLKFIEHRTEKLTAKMPIKLFSERYHFRTCVSIFPYAWETPIILLQKATFITPKNNETLFGFDLFLPKNCSRNMIQTMSLLSKNKLTVFSDHNGT